MDDVRPVSLVAAGVIPPPPDTDQAVRNVRFQNPLPKQVAAQINPASQPQPQAPAPRPPVQTQTAPRGPLQAPSLSDADAAKMDALLGRGPDAAAPQAGLSETDASKMDKILGRGETTPAAPGILARLEGRIRGEDPAVTAARARKMATDLEQGKPSVGGITLPSVPEVAGKVQRGLGQAAAVPFRAAGKLDVAAGIKTPEEAESRAQTYGNLTRDIGEFALAPVSKAAGVAGKLIRGAQTGALAGAQTLADTGSLADAAVSAAVGGILNVGGEVAGATAGKVIDYTKLNTKEYQRVGAEKAAELMGWAKKNVPAYSKLADGAQGLYDVIHSSKGAEVLQSTYDKAVRSVRSVVPEGRLIQVPADVAKKIGVKAVEAVQAVKEVPDELRAQLKLKPGEIPDWLKAQGYGAAVKQAADTVSVDLRAVVGKLQDVEKMGTDAARQAEAAIVRGVRNVSREAASKLQTARAQYATGQALRDLGQTGGGMFDKAGRFDPVKAQEAVKQAGSAAVSTAKRGVKAAEQAVEDTVKKGGEIVSRTLTPFERRLKGAEVGGIVGSMLPGPGSHILGIPGAAAGALLGPSVIPQTLYKGGPLRTGAQMVEQKLGPLASRGRAVVTPAMVQLLRSLGITSGDQQ